eukprot:TRINITY_DN334_c0_g1_i1.p2 TRINITY_DN334_c0_g1~~TRINITY_DN334_c0_g1_i1.p2  ORF type:complete len:321 (-),score=106.58 TRINITY_DN334_c0_g1_i1:59-1021(-)
MQPIHVVSPLLHSLVLSKELGVPVFLKMDTVQPSGSFKIRGLGLACQRAVIERGCTHLVCSSGGNAGLAVAHAGRLLGVKVTIVVPLSTVELLRRRLSDWESASVIIHGSVWDEADAKARQIVSEEGPTAAYLPPFDHPDVWEGNSSMVDEIADQLGQHGIQGAPGAIVCTVGGGGLFNGICQGLWRKNWKEVAVVAVETEGAASFYASVKAGQVVSLSSITSIAKSLGALRVSKESLEWTSRLQVINCLVSDKNAVDACLRFADEARALVEPACSAGLAVLYEKKKELICLEAKSIVVVVCGGNAVTIDQLLEWKRTIV